MRKPCLYAEFPHQEIRWNYGILRSGSCWKINCVSYQCLVFNIYSHIEIVLLIQLASSNKSYLKLKHPFALTTYFSAVI